MTSGCLRLFIVVAMLLLGCVRSWKNLSPVGMNAMGLASRALQRGSSMTVPSTLMAANAMTVRLHSNHRGRSNSNSRRGGMRDFRGNDRYSDNRRGSAPDPLARLNFKRTVKIDPAETTPVTEMSFSETTLKVLQQKGFSHMTPVQSQSYEYVHSGADVVARSRTGTGKTFAFGIPLIEKIVATGRSQRRTEGSGLPLVLILEPTRELAIQVSQELSVLCKPHRLRIMSVYGGSSYSMQEKAFREGVHIVVSTPGRLLDHIRAGTLDLSHVEHVVLDEGDTMLEMGFQKDVESILMNVKVPGESSREIAKRALETRDNNNKWGDRSLSFDVDSDLKDAAKSVQLLLFSATMPGWICQLTDKLMKDPIFLDAVQEGETRLAATITHYALPIKTGPGERLINTISGLIEDIILTKGEGGQTIVFTNTKEDADILVNSDCFGRLKAQVLHGDISQTTRQTTLKLFKDGSIDVLVATDVAARGLDVAGVELVIHTAPPNDADSYVHRSGRTGRAGRSGTSVLLYTGSDFSRLKQFERALNFQFTPMTAPGVAELSLASSSFAVKQMTLVEDEVIDHFRAYARDLIKKAQAGEVFDGAVGIEETGESPSESAIQAKNTTAVENLIARCIAVISNKMAIPSRSILTGEEGMVTLQFHASGDYSPKSYAIPIWQRFAANLLAKKLDLENVRFGKMRLGYDDKREIILLVDIEKAVARDILEKIQTIKLPQEVKVLEAETLPKLYEDNTTNSYDRNEGGRYEQDRNRRPRESYGGRRDNNDGRRDNDSRGSGNGKSWSRRSSY